MDLVVRQIPQVLFHQFILDSVPSTINEDQHGYLEHVYGDGSRTPNGLCPVRSIASPAENSSGKPEEHVRCCGRLVEGHPVLEIFCLFGSAEILAILVKDLELTASFMFP